jgi:hypothetical protein
MAAPEKRAAADAFRLSGRALPQAAAVAAALLAISAGSSLASGGTTATGSAPACLSRVLDNSAKLPNVPVEVSPGEGSDTADPDTELSFLGVPIRDISGVRVVGALSGSHAGRLEAYSQGDGASFVPDKPFTPGENVEVRVSIAIGGRGGTYSYNFHVDTPWSTAGVGPFPNPTVPPEDYQTFATLPGMQAPILTVTKPDRDPAAGDVFTSNGPAPGAYGALIYTPQGRLVWFDELSGGTVADDVNVQTYEGRSDLTFWQGKVLSLGFGQGEDVVLNRHYQTVATIKGGNGLEADLHEFQIAPHDVAYLTAYNPIRCNLHSSGGPSNGVILDAVVLEVDMRTGLVRWEWHALDHVNVNDSETSPPASRAWDWFHINSIDPEANGDVFISARNTWAGYQLAAGSGKILWTLGGLDSSFRMGAGTRTAWQHDGRILPNGDVTFFDDGDPGEAQSRGVTISLDQQTHTATLVSQRLHPNPPLLAASQGDMQSLPDGNVLVGYGGVPEISEYSKSGSLLFDAHLPYGLIFFRAYRHPWSGQPLTRPAIVAGLNNVGETIVHMSWNGATGVASWRVLAGTGTANVSPRATVATTGFESSTILPARYKYAAVQALDSGGQPLATSHTVRVESYAEAFPPGRSR